MNLGPLKSPPTKLVAVWAALGVRHRLVRVEHDRYMLERCDRDVPGLELWTTIHDTKSSPLRDGGAYARTVALLIAGIESLALDRT